MPSQPAQQLQINEHGRLRHFLTIEGLSRDILVQILDTAESFAALPGRPVKKVPLLRGKTIVNLFFEPSTRTRTTFELAAKRLSADVINLNISASATANAASREASEAKAIAEDAKVTADEANSKIDNMFKKSMYK